MNEKKVFFLLKQMKCVQNVDECVVNMLVTLCQFHCLNVLNFFSLDTFFVVFKLKCFNRSCFVRFEKDELRIVSCKKYFKYLKKSLDLNATKNPLTPITKYFLKLFMITTILKYFEKKSLNR